MTSKYRVIDYGTDIGSESNLIANQMALHDICKHIGADSLRYISLSGRVADAI